MLSLYILTLIQVSFHLLLLLFSCSVMFDSFDPMDCSMPVPVLHHLLEFAQLMLIESVIPSKHLILFYPLLLLPSIFPSSRVFSNEMALCLKWPKYWLKFQLQYQHQSVLPKNAQGWFPLGLTGLIFQTKGLSRVFPSTTFQKHQFFGAQPFFMVLHDLNQDLKMKFLKQRKRWCNVLLCIFFCEITSGKH